MENCMVFYDKYLHVTLMGIPHKSCQVCFTGELLKFPKPNYSKIIPEKIISMDLENCKQFLENHYNLFLETYSDPVKSVGTTVNNKYMITRSIYDDFRILNLKNSRQIAYFKASRKFISSEFTKNNKKYKVFSDNFDLIVQDLETHKRLAIFNGYNGHVILPTMNVIMINT